MSVYIKMQVNLSHVLSEMEDAGDLARIALEALDRCAGRLYREKKQGAAEVIEAARRQLTPRIAEAFPEPKGADHVRTRR